MELQTPTHTLTGHTHLSQLVTTHELTGSEWFNDTYDEAEGSWTSNTMGLTRTQAMMSAVCVDSQHSSAAPWEDAWCFPWVIATSSSHLRHDAPRTWPLEEPELKPSLRILFQSWNNQVVYIIFILHGLRYLFYSGLSHIALYYCYSCLLRRYLLYISGIFVFLHIYTHNTMRFSIFLYRCSDATLQWRCNRFALHTSYMYDD